MTEPLPQDLNTLYDHIQAEHTALLGLLRRNQETFRANLMACGNVDLAPLGLSQKALEDSISAGLKLIVYLMKVQAQQ